MKKLLVEVCVQVGRSNKGKSFGEITRKTKTPVYTYMHGHLIAGLDNFVDCYLINGIYFDIGRGC